MTRIDPNALPDYSHIPEQVQAAAAALRKAGAGVQETGNNVQSTWTRRSGLSTFYRAPEAGRLLAVMGPVQAEGNTIGSQSATVASALDTFAAEVAKIQQQLILLKADITVFNAEAGDEPLEGDTLDRYNGLINRMNAWGHTAFQRAERDCANKINALTGGPHYVPGDWGGDHNGRLPPGYQRYGWARVPDGVKLPWGKTIQEPDPWWQRVLKGFGGAAWSTVTGTFSLVDFTNWETFSNSWRGIYQLAYGASPTTWVEAVAGDKAARTAMAAWKAMGKEFLAWDDHAKGDHATGIGKNLFGLASIAPFLWGGKPGTAGKAGRLVPPAPTLSGLVNASPGSLTSFLAKIAELRATKTPTLIDPKTIRLDPPPPRELPTVGHIRRTINEIGAPHKPDFEALDRKQPQARTPAMAGAGARADATTPQTPAPTPDAPTTTGRGAQTTPADQSGGSGKPPAVPPGDSPPTSPQNPPGPSTGKTPAYDKAAYDRNVQKLDQDVIDDVGYGPNDKPKIPAKYQELLDQGKLQLFEETAGKKGSWNRTLNRPQKNAIYIVDDRYLYVTDDRARVTHAEGWLDFDPRKSDDYEERRNSYQQKTSGGKSRLPVDQGGHIFATKHKGPGEKLNLVAMLQRLNGSGRNNWWAMEQHWMKSRGGVPGEPNKGVPPTEPQPIHASVDIQYPKDGSKRPTRFIVRHRVGNNAPRTEGFDNTP
ncbi:DNA/RNA non-specific endonuclease [Spirillospora sp. CA-255316]